MISAVDPAVPGIENWAIGMQSADGDKLSATSPGTNMRIKWAADMTTQINNGTKGTPSLVADVVGDWREEMPVRTATAQRSACT